MLTLVETATQAKEAVLEEEAGAVLGVLITEERVEMEPFPVEEEVEAVHLTVERVVQVVTAEGDTRLLSLTADETPTFTPFVFDFL
jgi:hypothetical protein